MEREPHYEIVPEATVLGGSEEAASESRELRHVIGKVEVCVRLEQSAGKNVVGDIVLRSHSGKELSVSTLLPSGFAIERWSKMLNGLAGVDWIDRRIVLASSAEYESRLDRVVAPDHLATPKGLYVLFHELGHTATSSRERAIRELMEAALSEDSQAVQRKAHHSELEATEYAVRKLLELEREGFDFEGAFTKEKMREYALPGLATYGIAEQQVDRLLQEVYSDQT